MSMLNCQKLIVKNCQHHKIVNFSCSKHNIPLCWSNDTQTTPLHCAMHQNKGLIPFYSFTKLIALVQKFCMFGATFITFIACFFYSLQPID